MAACAAAWPPASSCSRSCSSRPRSPPSRRALQPPPRCASIPSVINDTIAWINQQFGLDIKYEDIAKQFNLSAGNIANIAGELAGGVLAVLFGFFSGIFDIVTIIVFAFYLAADGPRLRRTIGSWLPPGPQRVFVTMWDITVEKTGGFVISKVLLATISAFAHSIAFAIIGVPYWLPMGVLAGVVSQFIPTIGTYIGIIIPSLFSIFDDPIDVLWIVIFATVYQQVENYVFMPRVSRWTMNLHPGVALASVFAGVAIFGPIGAIIGMPLAAAALSIVETYGQRYELIPQLRELEAGSVLERPGADDTGRGRQQGRQQGRTATGPVTGPGPATGPIRAVTPDGSAAGPCCRPATATPRRPPASAPMSRTSAAGGSSGRTAPSPTTPGPAWAGRRSPLGTWPR
jgi:predicted PurR-regulated permease PerM